MCDNNEDDFCKDMYVEDCLEKDLMNKYKDNNDVQRVEDLMKSIDDIEYESIIQPSLDEPLNEPLNKTLNEPLNKTLNESLDEPLDEPLNKTLNEPLNKTLNESLDEPLDEPLNKTLNEPLNKTLNESLNEPLNKTLNESLNEPLNKTLNESLNESLDEPLNESLNEPLNEPLNESLNEPLNKTLNESLNEPLNENLDKPLDEPLETDDKDEDLNNGLIDNPTSEPLEMDRVNEKVEDIDKVIEDSININPLVCKEDELDKLSDSDDTSFNITNYLDDDSDTFDISSDDDNYNINNIDDVYEREDIYEISELSEDEIVSDNNVVVSEIVEDKELELECGEENEILVDNEEVSYILRDKCDIHNDNSVKIIYIRPDKKSLSSSRSKSLSLKKTTKYVKNDKMKIMMLSGLLLFGSIIVHI